MSILSLAAAAAFLLAAGPSASPPAERERWQDISVQSMNSGEISLPLGAAEWEEGPSVLRVQILLNRALFSPGMLDGRWGNNARQATVWFQKKNGLDATGVVDEATYDALLRASGRPRELVRPHVLTAAEVQGPFVEIPSSIYEQARLACSCFESLSEKLAEQFHSRAALLDRLNPGVELDRAKAGDTISVPVVRAADAAKDAAIAELLVSGSGNFVQALDARGNILLHFASTMGSTLDPSPEGVVTVRDVAVDPWWNYQPAILKSVKNKGPSAMIPPGPNNAVGRVWIGLTVPRYGIHGTSSPETIGYAVSAGCVRLPNWDALFLARRLKPGVRVRFEDTRNGQRVHARRPRARVLGTRVDSIPPAP